MGYICQKACRLSGVEYMPGDPVPAEAVEADKGFLTGKGFVATVPDGAASGGDQSRVAQLEARVAELEAGEARLAESEARLRSMAARLSEPATAPEPAPAAKKAGARRRQGH